MTKHFRFISGIYKNYRSLSVRMSGRTRHASNVDYNVSMATRKQLDAGALIPGELLQCDNKAQEQLLNNVCNIANLRTAGQFTDTETIEKTGGFISGNMADMTTEFLDRIEQIAITSGLFRLAYAIRRQNEELVMSMAQMKGPAARQDVSKLFWCFLNRGNYTVAGEMPGNREINKKPVLRRHICQLCNSFRLNAEGEKTAAEHRDDKEFAEFVRDKSIAIIGPSSSGADICEEIRNDFDRIIRMKYRGRDTLPESQRELGVNITYYRDRAGPWDKKMATADGSVEYLADLDFAVLLKENKQVIQKILPYTKARVARSLDYFYFSPAKHNLVQHILFDLLCFEPKRIKVFNSNLFLSETRHDKGYKPATYNRGGPDFLYAWAKHNLISQYNYVMHLYKRGIVEADARLGEILELGTEEYIRQMEALINSQL